jgi:hypothetical protein
MEHHDEVESKFAEEHHAAVESMAAERYVLGEMEPAERDAFEEHFFDCVECSGDVRDETKIAAGVGAEEALQTAPRAGRFNWWAVAASVLAAGLGYQTLFVVVPQMAERERPATMARLGQQLVLEPASRGVTEPVAFRRGEAIPLTIVIPPENPQPFYDCEVRDVSGHTLASQRVPGPDAKEPVPMVLQPGILQSGKYTLYIRTGDREIAVYPFTVEVK